MEIIRGSGTLSVALCHVCAKEIVICANLECSKALVIREIITDYVYAIAFTLPFPFFLSLSGTKKREPYTRAHLRDYIGAVSERTHLDTTKPSFLYT